MPRPEGAGAGEQRGDGQPAVGADDELDVVHVRDRKPVAVDDLPVEQVQLGVVLRGGTRLAARRCHHWPPRVRIMSGIAADAHDEDHDEEHAAEQRSRTARSSRSPM